VEWTPLRAALVRLTPTTAVFSLMVVIGSTYDVIFIGAARSNTRAGCLLTAFCFVNTD